ncbi:MAG TPA: T9SS type A sorting domain-containing protein [Bacteroidia bacterium]|nr:T9SS type A sorting domain-containing protein [Bacteroidia bacterium]
MLNDNSGKTCIAGYFTSDTINFGGSNILINHTAAGPDYADVFIVEYDQNGNVLWSKSTGSLFDDMITGVSSDNSNNIYVTGYFANPYIVFGHDTLTTPFQGLFTAKLGQPVNVAIPEFKKREESVVFPNPFSDRIDIRTNDYESSEVIFYEITLQKLLQQTFIHTVSLNTAGFAKGIYIYEVRNKKGVIKKGKVVKD